MRDLEINKKPISYLNYKNDEDVKDEDGNLTGEKQVTYYPLKKIKAHVSGAKGSSMVEVFGTDVSYDKTILFTKSEFLQTGINENTVFFIDKKPAYKDGTPLYDYRVSRIAETINQVVVAILKVGNR